MSIFKKKISDKDDLLGKKVTIERLVGRNYYHYTNSKLDEKQPLILHVNDNLECLAGEGECDEITPEIEIHESYWNWCPDDCWIKRLVDDEEAYKCYIICLEINDNGVIEKAYCINELSKPSGWDQPFMALLTQRDRSDFYYETVAELPEKVVAEFANLLSGPYLKPGIKLNEMKLLEKYVNEGRAYYALQSPYRLAFMETRIDTDEKGVIQTFVYSSLLSDGRRWSKLFSNREIIENRNDEKRDMLLHILDKNSGK